MINRNRSPLSRAQINRDYPHQVEIPIPAGGLGSALDQMHDWCRHEKLKYQTLSAGRYPDEAIRWCFKDEDAARMFGEDFG